jgi:hypothetical protein
MVNYDFVIVLAVVICREKRTIEGGGKKAQQWLCTVAFEGQREFGQ